MKKIKSEYSKEAELWECLNSAYADLQILLQGTFINISKLPNQLTFLEFQSLFKKYDWNDIFNMLDELENAPDLDNVESVDSTLIECLKSNNKLKHLTNPRENTYYKVWAGLMSEDDF